MTEDRPSWTEVPLDEIDLPTFLGRPRTSTEDRLSAVVDGARAVREERDRQRAAELAAFEVAHRRARRRRRAGRALIGAVVIVALVGAGLVLRHNPTVTAALDDLAASRSAGDASSTSVPLTTVPRPTTIPSTEPGPPTTDVAEPVVPKPPPPGRPTPTLADSTTPLGTPAPVLADGPHAFASTDASGQHAAYDPCRPISVVVNPRLAPPDADGLVDSALAEISRATGLQFVREGSTDEEASQDREAYQPERYGDRWAPLLIAWSDEAVNPELAGQTVGYGGSSWIEADGSPVYVSGSVALDAPSLVDVAGYWGPIGVRSVLLHELGHVVGLDHVDDVAQLMYPGTTQVLELGAGDLAGLAELGQGPCVLLL